MAASQPAAELRDVSRRFADLTAVDRVSLRVGDGEFFSLLGPSGCGKTTTLRLIAGFELPTEGAVLLQGEDITRRPPHVRNVGMVFQNYALFPHLSVFENVAFGLRLRRVPAEHVRSRVTRALAMVRLEGLDQRMPSQLSGGQQQRVALARALVIRPAVVLLDEPLGALDLKLRKAMQLELKTLQREVGLTFIYVTHDQEEALTMSDRIAVMEGGRILQVADPLTIYDQPASRFVADFIGLSNFLAGRVLDVSREWATVEVTGPTTIRAPRSGEPTPGQHVTVAVRPERMRLEAGAPDERPEPGSNQVSGIVRDVVFTGSDTQYFVALDGEVVQVRVQNQSARGTLPQPVAGQRVRVSWDVSSTRVLVA